jgi:Holliday junction resolvase
MLESKVQRKLIEQLEKEGYYVIKLSVTNKNGIADILAIPPGCSVEFYEVKQKGKRPSSLQMFRAKELKKHGVKTYLYDGEKEEL